MWKNRDDIDFESAEDVSCTQKFELTYDKDGSFQYQVKRFKFQNVASLTLFFSRGDGESTQIDYLGFKGEGTKDKRQIVEAVYEARALESDP
eukprot:CAMPEP_0167741758 /NCGR_PEP_ID=MMETSP0110_2-20121227/1035_1 /TAXON_ID=629695 /ORGANISM="Gymnochlora sp., Strain CCMP2014" /LENGTH=91 /DNA_ID=CAMNT_0007625847 /DNA_START=280 /DNA_END=555 /DNA_ORIENTATION=+